MARRQHTTLCPGPERRRRRLDGLTAAPCREQGTAVPRFFNTAGPNNPAAHYTLPVLERLPQVRQLIEQNLYFVLHAPRQVGKTTTLLALGRELTAGGKHVGLLVSMEQGSVFPDDPGAAELAILGAWRTPQGDLPGSAPPWPDAAPGERIGAALHAWAKASPRPLVLFLDEIDALQDASLISVLRQIRSGYPRRPGHFPGVAGPDWPARCA